MKHDLFEVVKAVYCSLGFICVLFLVTRARVLEMIIEFIGYGCIGALLFWWGSMIWMVWRKEVWDGCKSKQRGQGAC